MEIRLTSYRDVTPPAEGEEEVSEVELHPDTERYLSGKENFIRIKLGNKVARVKLGELRAAVNIADKLE